MKQMIFFTLFLFCCLQANGQDDYMKLADECFEKGDYECAKRNYTLFQTWDGRDMSAQIQKADECFRTLIAADDYFKEKEYGKARDRYKTVLDKNPKDPYAKKQYDLCEDNTSDNETQELIKRPDFESRFSDSTEITSDNLNIEMIFVRGGSFMMGCTAEQGNDCYNNEKPAHRVTVNDFYIGTYEVTQAQWKAVMNNNPSRFRGDNLPVERVKWSEVQDFIVKLNSMTGKQYRLPTEAEWEYAARGGNKSQGYKYSGSNTIDDVAWYWKNSGLEVGVQAVGTKLPNELGIYDMSGNVLEWCSNQYGSYDSNAQTDPQGTSTGSHRVSRGGRWDNSKRSMRVSFRSHSVSGSRENNLGFRLALSPR